MNKRNYNVFFNTHTVSGIVISIALFIIFFAGAFALFKDEIAIWEEGVPLTHTDKTELDYDQFLADLDEEYTLYGRDIQINFEGEEDKLYIFMPSSKDSLASEEAKQSHYFSLDTQNKQTKTYDQLYSLGEFLYRLHFFAQLPTIGIYLAGFVSFFFLFAIVSGIIVHWRKIIPQFFAFDPRKSFRRIWADAHTLLGVIGLPFQFVFALTGTYFCLSLFVLLPANFLYDNDRDRLMEDFRPSRKSIAWQEGKDIEFEGVNAFIQKVESKWNHFHMHTLRIKNYGGASMKYILLGELSDKEKFLGAGRIIYNPISREIEEIRDPNTSVYVEDFQKSLTRLHYADFGGQATKWLYFLLAFITCFVIITGVLVWVKARDKKSASPKQKSYTQKVGHIYMAICMSMLPVTALAFVYSKVSYSYVINHQNNIYLFYFLSWVALALFYRFKRDNLWVSKHSFLWTGIIGLIIPVISGLISGNWVWNSLIENQIEIATIDCLWLAMGSFCLIIYAKMTKQKPITEQIPSKKTMEVQAV